MYPTQIRHDSKDLRGAVHAAAGNAPERLDSSIKAKEIHAITGAVLP